MDRLRAKEARLQIVAEGVLQRHLNLVITQFDIKPRGEITQSRFTGDKRERADLRVDGYDLSFTQQERGPDWYALWRLYEDAELAGAPFPTVSAIVTKMYRSRPSWSLSMSGELILMPGGNPHNEHDYTTINWSGTCRFAKVV